ncbi:TniQ family protein [Embleya sp. NPDC056575]|uniref:TniQ family protein n=1 Tax=unclassified Embleya TaxID=2699296 RepID=UPI00369AF87C
MAIPATPPSGALRVAPVAFESTASYPGRLAGAYRMGAARFLDGLGIEPDGPGERTEPGPAAPRVEIHLDTEALHRLAAFTRVPHHHLTQALPRPTTAAESGPRPPRRTQPAGIDDTVGPTRVGEEDTTRRRTAHARVRVLDTDERPVRACPVCVRRRTRGAGDVAWTYPPADRMWCPRHRYRASGPRLPGPLDTGALPEIDLAYRVRLRLAQHRDATVAYARAGAVVTRWYDRGHHLARRRQGRLGRLTWGNPALATTDRGVPAVLLGRSVVTYPETVALARAFTTLPRPVSRDTPHERAYAYRPAKPPPPQPATTPTRWIPNQHTKPQTRHQPTPPPQRSATEHISQSERAESPIK